MEVVCGCGCSVVKEFALPSVHKGLILGILLVSLGIQPKIDSLGQRRRESMAQRSEMHKSWPQSFALSDQGKIWCQAFPKSHTHKWEGAQNEHVDCLLKGNWLLLPNSVWGGLGKSTIARMLILLWRTGISPLWLGQELFPKPALKESSAVALSPFAPGAEPSSCCSAHLAVPSLSTQVGVSKPFWRSGSFLVVASGRMPTERGRKICLGYICCDPSTLLVLWVWVN